MLLRLLENGNPKKSIRIQLTLSISLLISLMVLAMGLFFIFRSKEHLKKSLISKGISLTRAISIQAGNEIALNETFTLRKWINDLIIYDSEFAYAIVKNNSRPGIPEIMEYKSSIIHNAKEIFARKKIQKIISGKISLGRVEKEYSVNIVNVDTGDSSQDLIEVEYPLFVGGLHWGWLTAGLSMENLNLKIEQNFEILLIGLVLSLLLGITGSVFIAKGFMVPLKVLTDKAEKLARHEFTEDIQCLREDELGFLANVFDTMKNNLRGLIQEILWASDSLNGSTREFFLTLEGFACNSQNQSLSIEQITASFQSLYFGIEKILIFSQKEESRMDELMQEMSRMSQAIEQMSNTLISTDRLLEQFSDTANNGRESLKAMVVSMDTISARSMKISDITAMIQDIADRTNLLSINAALEAARAGIHGRGFAVVADEMVKLSDLTANSANLINEIIDENNKEIGKGTAMVNTAAQNINKLLEYGREFRTKMSETLEKMNIQEDTSRKVNRVLDDTLNAFQETKSSLNSQIQVIAAVKDSIEEINAISKENAMGALVLSRNTSDLMGMAEKLKNHINYFKLN